MTAARTVSDRATQRVVVGVDGSSPSLRALQWAADYACARHLSVEVIVVWDPPFPEGIDAHTSAEQMLDRLITHHRAQCASLSISGRVVQGDPAKVLEAASEGAGLLVVAPRGHGELVGLLLGSVSEHCVAHAKCPVLVYRDAPQDAGPGGPARSATSAETHRAGHQVTGQSSLATEERLDLVMRDPGGI